MKRILFFDDDPIRHAQFRLKHSELTGEDVTHVYTPTEAIRALSAGVRFDEVWLDHDMDLLKDSEPGTGWTVAVFITEYTEDLPKRVVIHSYNDEKAAEMARLLRTASIPVTVRPFGAWV